MKRYIYQLKTWPHFTWDHLRLAEPLARVHHVKMGEASTLLSGHGLPRHTSPRSSGAAEAQPTRGQEYQLFRRGDDPIEVSTMTKRGGPVLWYPTSMLSCR
jgi:hypothetical protein